MLIYFNLRLITNFLYRVMNEKTEYFSELLEIMETLRKKCPWDRKQTRESLRTNTIEETYELSDAILSMDYEEIRKELGDLIMHIVFYSSIAEEEGHFSIAGVLQGINEKLKYRHPHIYGNVKAETPEEVERNWEQLKLKEKGRKHKVLEGVPVSMPSLVKALRLQEKASGVGFDWGTKEEVWEKVHEELAEFEEECRSGNTEGKEQEFGDILFALVNAARKYGINPDTALEETNRKFVRRFDYVEENIGKPLPESSLEDMDALWNEAKGKGL